MTKPGLSERPPGLPPFPTIFLGLEPRLTQLLSGLRITEHGLCPGRPTLPCRTGSHPPLQGPLHPSSSAAPSLEPPSLDTPGSTTAFSSVWKTSVRFSASATKPAKAGPTGCIVSPLLKNQECPPSSGGLPECPGQRKLSFLVLHGTSHGCRGSPSHSMYVPHGHHFRAPPRTQSSSRSPQSNPVRGTILPTISHVKKWRHSEGKPLASS